MKRQAGGKMASTCGGIVCRRGGLHLSEGRKDGVHLREGCAPGDGLHLNGGMAVVSEYRGIGESVCQGMGERLR